MTFNIVVTREAGVRRDDLHELDADVAGIYRIDASSEDAALDEFHSTIPIKALDDFFIEAVPLVVRGLHCAVIGSNCTNGGATANVSHATLIGDGVSGPFEPSEDAPALALEYDLNPKGVRGGYLMVANVAWLAKVAGIPEGYDGGAYECMESNWTNKHRIVRVKAVPIIDGKPKAGMFGGNFITTSDSRFPMTAPIPVFDRFE